MFTGRSFRLTRRWLGAGIALITVAMVGRLPAQEATPEFAEPPLSGSLWDFVTGMPISYNTKVLMTPKLLRPPFAGEPTDTAKGLAAAIKAQQIDAKNRVAAAEFLGTVDCIAYPESQEQLVGLIEEDPIEKVRYAAAKAIKEQFTHGKDRTPGRKQKRQFDQCRGCCGNQEILNRLAKRAYEYDDFGCHLEPSERVRKVLREALGSCCPHCCHRYASYSEEVAPEPVEEEMAPAAEEESAKPVEAPKPEPKPLNPPKPPAEESPEQAQQINIDAADETKVTSASHETTAKAPEVECLRGYCPVAMQNRELVPANVEFASTHEGFTYYFSSAKAKASFDSNPQEYAPVLGGTDVLVLKRDGQKVAGNYFVNYQGRPYWFATRENRSEFLSHPQDYVD